MSATDSDLIERFIRERGVTKCPAAIAVADGLCSARLSPDDRAAMVEHFNRQIEAQRRTVFGRPATGVTRKSKRKKTRTATPEGARP